MAAEPVRVTVMTGERQVFLGGGYTIWSSRPAVCQATFPLSDSQKEHLVNLESSDLGMGNVAVIRIGYVQVYKPESVNVALYKNDIMARVKANPKVQFLFTPVGGISMPDYWGERIAKTILALEKACGITINYTDIGQEPNQISSTWASPLIASSIPTVLKEVRSQLDEQGLNHVKIIAPGPSNMDAYMWDAAQAIMLDPAALDALYAWEYHSYNMSITEDFENYLSSMTGKPIWQTESCVPEGDFAVDDSMAAAQLCTRFLADMNHGVNVWMDFLGVGETCQATKTRLSNSQSAIAYDATTGNYEIYLKYYYFRQLARTFVRNTAIRKCTTDLQDSQSYDMRNIFMEYTFGKKIPLAASAGIRPDGSWVLAAVNHTDLRFTLYGSTYYPKTEYNVTFFVEELAGSADKAFTVWHINNGSRSGGAGVIESTPAIMHNGEVTVSLGHCDLVCLTSGKFDTTFMSTTAPILSATRNPRLDSREHTEKSDWQVQSGGGSLSVQFSIQQPSQISANLYSLNGSLVKKVISASYTAGNHSISCSTTGLRTGSYLLSIINGQQRMTRKIVIAR